MNETFYHGTQNKNAKEILKEKKFNPGDDSENLDFLGEGVYFWQDPIEAGAWNIHSFKKNFRKENISKVKYFYCILEALIIEDDTAILDLDTRKNKAIYNDVRKTVEARLRAGGVVNFDANSLSDATIINYLTENNMIDGITIIKKRYPITDEDKREKSRLNQLYRLMICVKDTKVIKEIKKFELCKDDWKLLNIN